MSSALYDIGIKAIAVQDALYEAMGEITPEIEASMDALLAEGEKSLVSAAYVVDKLDNDAEFCRAEAKRLTDRAASLERGTASLKARMVFAVDAAFGGKIKTATRTIWAQNAKPSVTVELADGVTVDSVYETHSELVKRTLSLDNTAIKNRWSAGDPLPTGINVTEHPATRYLRIK